MATHKQEGPATFSLKIILPACTAHGVRVHVPTSGCPWLLTSRVQQLPAQKLSHLLALLAEWVQEALMLPQWIGRSAEPCRKSVVRPGRLFICCMYDLLKELPESLEWVRLPVKPVQLLPFQFFWQFFYVRYTNIWKPSTRVIPSRPHKRSRSLSYGCSQAPREWQWHHYRTLDMQNTLCVHSLFNIPWMSTNQQWLTFYKGPFHN